MFPCLIMGLTQTFDNTLIRSCLRSIRLVCTIHVLLSRMNELMSFWLFVDPTGVVVAAVVSSLVIIIIIAVVGIIIYRRKGTFIISSSR